MVGLLSHSNGLQVFVEPVDPDIPYLYSIRVLAVSHVVQGWPTPNIEWTLYHKVLPFDSIGDALNTGLDLALQITRSAALN